MVVVAVQINIGLIEVKRPVKEMVIPITQRLVLLREKQRY